MQPPPIKPIHFCILLFLAYTQWHCIAKVERACRTTNDCAGFSTQHVCVQRKCIPGICEPDPTFKRPQPCHPTACKPNDETCNPTLTGTCQTGIQYCTANGSAWTSCIGAIEPTNEICDGKDNDCDGTVDNGLDCACTPHDIRTCHTTTDTQRNAKDTSCREGAQQCIQTKDGWRWGPCNGEITPGRQNGELPTAQLAACMYRDANCDGQPDDASYGNCSCKTIGETRSCYSGPKASLDHSPCKAGTQTCQKATNANGIWSLCKTQVTPTSELLDPCNGKDDDCDGIIDNQPGSTRPLWRACGDPKECKTERCLPNNTWSLCETRELCNNKQDDDCDGQIDETECQRE